MTRVPAGSACETRLTVTSSRTTPTQTTKPRTRRLLRVQTVPVTARSTLTSEAHPSSRSATRASWTRRTSQTWLTRLLAAPPQTGTTLIPVDRTLVAPRASTASTCSVASTRIANEEHATMTEVTAAVRRTRPHQPSLYSPVRASSKLAGAPPTTNLPVTHQA